MKRHREYPRLRPLFAWTAVLLLVGAAGTPPSLAQPHWTNTIQFPDEPYRVIGSSAANPDWIKFTIKVSEPETVYYQDSNLYTFHYDFVTAELDDYVGISLEDFNEIALYEDGQELILGAVLMPASGIYPEPLPIQEYGIQFVRMDPYEPEEIVTLFNLVKDTVIAAPEVEAFYFPTYEQWETAQDNLEYFADQGITVSTASRWADGNACYSEGWALGELKYFDGDDIEEAYLTGALLPEDIVLTDGVPATMPFVAGILTLTPSTPNSHVAILANNFGIPFVHLAVQEDAALALSLVGHRIVLRAYDQGYQGCDVQMIDVEGVLTEEQITQILALKIPPPLDISPVQTYGEFSENTNILDLSDVPYFGGKAANYGFLRRAIPDNSPVATAFSFDLWTDFLDQMLANGNTLREEIELTLSGYTWPPNMEDLADDLDYVRDLIRDKEDDLPTTFSPEAQIAVFLTIFDPQYGFDPYLNIRFRSSTNVEDTAQFTGAGLYDSYSGCVLDDLDGDDDGPSWCDPEEEEERGVFRALRKVFASFYNDNAYLERLRHSVDEDEVGMAVLTHHSFPDDLELANGVATLKRTGSTSCQILFVSQVGAVSVTNPEGGAIPEEVDVSCYSTFMWADVLRYSSLVQLGDTVLTFEDDYFAFAEMMRAVANDYAAAIGEPYFTLDFEYKKVAPGGGAMPEGGLVVKQVRRLPEPDTSPSITPFLINVPMEYCTFQGEYGDVFANHRLKSRWVLATKNMWMTAENLAESFYTDAWLEYTDGCWTRTYSGQLPEFPNAGYEFDEEDHESTDTWEFAFLNNPRDYALLTPWVRTLVSPAESPVLILDDLGYQYVTVEHERPVPSWDWTGPIMTTTDTIRLTEPPQADPRDILQERLFEDEETGIVIASTFYWPPPPGGIVIYTAPLVRWDETIIVGLTSDPIVLHGWYSQTYRPGHHNISEFFIFEPRLEPGISPDILAELTDMGIQYVYVEGSPYPGHVAEFHFYDDDDCEIVPCFSNADCGYPAYGFFCRKAWGDCDGIGICTPMPEGCFDIWDPVCGCDGHTYSNACYAAMAGVSVDYDGACMGDCEVNDQCDEHAYCKKPVSECDGKGLCHPRPEACPDVWQPVCGCDGQTYSNACYAAMAGVSVKYEGPCDGDYCWSNDDCAEEDYCFFHVCAAETGVCMPRPTSCPEIYDPVCGCNGKTYDNACFAAMAGVSVDYEGECGDRCKDSLDCPKSEYCDKPIGQCDAEGVCRPRPDVCPEVWQPVCGCNGVTYYNECYAAAAGWSVDYVGPCDTDYCWSNEDCDDDHYCFFHVCAVETGVCMPRPTSCPEIWDPVCGCDGNVYASACHAAMAGVSVDDTNSCFSECEENGDCPKTRYCAKAIGDCDGKGLCKPRPPGCPKNYDPVCGCDGVTYGNACFAALAGVSIAYEGECFYPCKENGDCPTEDAYCAKAIGDCDGEGVCTPRPGGCPEDWDPVCGCDGTTYSNACFAAMAGVSIKYLGPCEEDRCWSNKECDEKDYCFFHVCAAETGVCRPRPTDCPEIWDPVCGCDGKVYASACHAAMAGVSVDYSDACFSPCKDGTGCPKSQYCAKAVGDCDGEGLCKPRPTGCPKNYDPVCGCNGVTYGNACFAAMAGVSVDYVGPCKSDDEFSWEDHP